MLPTVAKMSEALQIGSGEPDLVQVVVDGLRKVSPLGGQIGESRVEQTHTERISLPKLAPVSTLWDKIKDMGYDPPEWIESGQEQVRQTTTKLRTHPFESIEVVQNRPSEKGKCININETLISFANRQLGGEIKLNINENIPSEYGSNMDYIKDDRGLRISFHRTIRMPDDDKLHQLPGSLGTFPLFNVSAYANHLPGNITGRGGVFLPMWQREALWMQLDAPYEAKYALRVFVGAINAVSGRKMDEKLEESGDGTEVQDYVVVPGQEWLDGICVGPGIVRQFVAMPLGSGYTVEGQKTGEEKYGGLQIEIIPSYQQHSRVWLRELLDVATPETTRGSFNWQNTLNEFMTPLEHRLSPGDTIRCYPASPTYEEPLKITELDDNTQDGNIRIKVRYYKHEHEASQLYTYLSGQVRTGGAVFRKARRPRSSSEPRSCHESRSTPEPRSSLTSSGLGPPMAEVGPVMVKGGPALEFERCWETEDNGLLGAENPTVRAEDNSSINVITTDLQAMGLAAGGKLVQDIYRDNNSARIWNTEASRLVHVHILDPTSCENVTHIVPQPPPLSAEEYVEANMPFFVVEEQVENRVEAGDFGNVVSVSAMDKEKGVTTEPEFDPTKPRMCKECETRLCDCIIRPCDHQFCNVCIKKLDSGHGSVKSESDRQWKCPICGSSVLRVAGFSAPMNLPGEEALKVKVPVHVLKVEDGRVKFKSIQKTRI